MDRKDFLKSTLALCGMAVIPTGVMQSCSKQNNFGGPSNVNFTLDLTSSANAALNNVGGSIISNGVLIMHTSSAVYTALSATCTHQGCTVGYNQTSHTIICPCHGGTYNATSGAVISGPPPAALAKYTVTQAGNILTIKS